MLVIFEVNSRKNKSICTVSVTFLIDKTGNNNNEEVIIKTSKVSSKVKPFSSTFKFFPIITHPSVNVYKLLPVFRLSIFRSLIFSIKHPPKALYSDFPFCKVLSEFLLYLQLLCSLFYPLSHLLYLHLE